MHIAIIMDGNGRWATKRNLLRQAGHRAGAKAADAVVRCAARSGVKTLTLFAFSSDNWGRPLPEVEVLFGLLRRYLIGATDRCLAESIRMNVIGRRDRLNASLRAQIEQSERLTAGCSRMHLRLAVDYSSRHSIVAAGCCGEVAEIDSYRHRLGDIDHSDPVAPDVDLLIRTGGEKRLSDFLLWECAYAELLFLDCLWPDFDDGQFDAALSEFGRRRRTFGRLPVADATAEDRSCR